MDKELIRKLEKRALASENAQEVVFLSKQIVVLKRQKCYAFKCEAYGFRIKSFKDYGEGEQQIGVQANQQPFKTRQLQ